ncbi:hypothetical protein LEP1GSC074_2141 [Leptospira noguchii str. Hook]|nr:hypothetical protein LEP1GSC074_2141 [Leptospira noguchii str. Hook]
MQIPKVTKGQFLKPKKHVFEYFLTYFKNYCKLEEGCSLKKIFDFITKQFKCGNIS